MVLSSSLERQLELPLHMAKEHTGKACCTGKAKGEKIFYRHKRQDWMRGSASPPGRQGIQATLLLLVCVKGHFRFPFHNFKAFLLYQNITLYPKTRIIITYKLKKKV